MSKKALIKDTMDKIDLNILLQDLPGSMYWKNKEGVYLWCNNSLCELAGLPKTEIIGKDDYYIGKKLGIPREVVDTFIAVDKTVIRTGHPQLNVEELPFPIANGKIIHQLTNKIPLKNNLGEIIGVVGISFDITTLKENAVQLNRDKEKAERQVKNAFKNLEAIMSSLPGNVYWKDKNGVYQGCNDSLLVVAGIKSKDNIIGKTDYELAKILEWEKEVADSFRKVDMEVMLTGIPRLNFDEPPFSVNGNTIYQLSSKVPLRNGEHEIIGVLGISIDVTELKKTQKALAEQIQKTEQAHLSKGEFLTTASHEIRNPLSNTISIVQSMLKGELNKLKDVFFQEVVDVLNKNNKSEQVEKIKKLFHTVMENCHEAEEAAYRALNALKSLDDLHRLQLQGVQPSLIPIKVSHLIENSIARSAYPNNKQLEIISTIDISVPEAVTIDYENISKALGVFIGNSIRFSHCHDQIKISVKATSKNKQDYLVICIQDFGDGMAETQIEDLFCSPFNESETQKKRLYPKPSVQLLQAKMRIEASGGSLSIKSKLNQGTTISVTLPYQQLPESKTIPPKPRTFSPSSKYLLLVEDDAGIAKTTAAHLRDVGYKVDVAATGANAIKLATEKLYDLIIMDLTLPDISGIEVTHKINKIYENDLLVVGFTSHASEQDSDNCYEAGMSLVLTKPINKNQLKEAIENVFYAKDHENDEE